MLFVVVVVDCLLLIDNFLCSGCCCWVAVVVVLDVDNLLFLGISITFLQFALVTSLLIDKDDQTENNNLSADAQERPQGGKLAYMYEMIIHLIFA